MFFLSYSRKGGENVTEFEKLFNENRDFIFKYLMKLSRNASLAEELTQETFFRAYINYPSLKNKEKASVWLCQIARNTYFAYFNEQKKYTSASVTLKPPFSSILTVIVYTKRLDCLQVKLPPNPSSSMVYSTG